MRIKHQLIKLKPRYSGWMLNKMAQSSKFRIFACFSSLYIFMVSAISPIRAFIYQGEVDELASEYRLFPKISVLEITGGILPYVAGFVVAFIFLFYRPQNSKRLGSLILISVDLLARLAYVYHRFPIEFEGSFQIIMFFLVVGLPLLVGFLFDISVLIYIKDKHQIKP